MTKQIILGSVAFLFAMGMVLATYETAVTENAPNSSRIYTKDYLMMTAENEDGVGVVIAPPSEEIKNMYR